MPEVVTGASPSFRGVRRIGVLGGSFDPVHRGHLHVARAAERAFGLERIVWIPAARPPHKPGRELASGADRARMLAIALAGEPRWCVDSLELQRSGPSYTVDTLRALPARLGLDPGAELFLLIGEDNLAGLASWKEASAVLELAQPIVVRRSGSPPLDLARLAPRARERLQQGLLEVAPVDASSTELRAALARGADPGDALAAGVLEYIRAHGLYREAAR